MGEVVSGVAAYNARTRARCAAVTVPRAASIAINAARSSPHRPPD